MFLGFGAFEGHIQFSVSQYNIASGTYFAQVRGQELARIPEPAPAPLLLMAALPFVRVPPVASPTDPEREAEPGLTAPLSSTAATAARTPRAHREEPAHCAPTLESRAARSGCTSVQFPSLYSQRTRSPFAPLDDDWGGCRASRTAARRGNLEARPG